MQVIACFHINWKKIMKEPIPKKLSARERILEAALDLFSKFGFHATTTRKISQLADINEVTLFRHFKKKIDLFSEIMEQILELGMDASRLTNLDLSPKEAIKFIIHEMMTLLENNPREFKMLHFAGLEKVEGFEAGFVKKNAAIMLEYLADVFESLQNLGEISKREDPCILAGMLMTQVHGLVSARVITDLSPLKKYSREQLSQSVANHFLSR